MWIERLSSSFDVPEMLFTQCEWMSSCFANFYRRIHNQTWIRIFYDFSRSIKNAHPVARKLDVVNVCHQIFMSRKYYSLTVNERCPALPISIEKFITRPGYVFFMYA